MHYPPNTRMMPQLVPQTFMMDQQLELPSSWYGDCAGKRGQGGGGRGVFGGLGLGLAPSSPDELFTSLGISQNEWDFQDESFMVEPEPFESDITTTSGARFTLEDYDDALVSLASSKPELHEGCVGRPSPVAADGLLGSRIGPDDLCCDGWAETGPASRTSDDRICDRSFEDVFQVDTQDLLCSPTLAQLNSEQDGCSDLLDDIANVIVKEEYGLAPEEAASGNASSQSCALHPTPVSSSRTDRGIEQVPSATTFGFGFPPALPVVETPTASLSCLGVSSGEASGRTDRRALVSAATTASHAAAAAASQTVMAHAKAVQPPEKRRRLSDSVTLYDLLISKSSPQQLQVLMNRRGEGGMLPSQDTVGRHETAGQLQHKKPRHGTVAPFGATASIISTGISGSDVGSLFVDSCGDCRVEASAAAKTFVREPRRRTSLPAASLARARQPSECSTASTYDEGLDEDDGGGYTSDADSCSSCSTWTSKDGKQRQHRPQRQERHSPYFWQYNSQSKGPRGERFELTLAPSDDPHKPVNFTDPVFDPEQHVRIRHVGRARKGDGNDVRPNPRRLVSIGKELAKLNRLMNDVTGPAAGSGASFAGAAESSMACRPDSKREKNKLASRACRLKKKAQHEANKVKLCGLEQERKELMEVLDAVKTELQKHRVSQASQNAGASAGELCPLAGAGPPSFTAMIRELTSRILVTKVAGRTSQFVSEVVAQVEAGDPLGGLVVAED